MRSGNREYMFICIGLLILAGYFKYLDIVMTDIAMGRGYREINILSFLTHNYFGLWGLINMLGLFFMIIGFIISYKKGLLKEYSVIMFGANLILYIVLIINCYNLVLL